MRNICQHLIVHCCKAERTAEGILHSHRRISILLRLRHTSLRTPDKVGLVICCEPLRMVTCECKRTWTLSSAVWLPDSALAQTRLLLCKERPICFYRSKSKVCRDKKRHLVGGPCQHGKRSNGSLYWFTGQGTSLDVRRHAAVVAQAFRPPQHDIEYARVRWTAVQRVRSHFGSSR